MQIHPAAVANVTSVVGADNDELLMVEPEVANDLEYGVEGEAGNRLSDGGVVRDSGREGREHACSIGEWIEHIDRFFARLQSRPARREHVLDEKEIGEGQSDQDYGSRWIGPRKRHAELIERQNCRDDEVKCHDLDRPDLVGVGIELDEARGEKTGRPVGFADFLRGLLDRFRHRLRFTGPSLPEDRLRVHRPAGDGVEPAILVLCQLQLLNRSSKYSEAVREMRDVILARVPRQSRHRLPRRNRKLRRKPGRQIRAQDVASVRRDRDLVDCAGRVLSSIDASWNSWPRRLPAESGTTSSHPTRVRGPTD